MKMIISPAKSLNFDSALPTKQFSTPDFIADAERINGLLKKKSMRSLGKLMNISEQLSQLNWERNQSFSLPFTTENARPALFAFDGDVYSGIDAYSLSAEKIQRAHDKLRILSGLYGLLKPLDLIQPYRLEMGTKMNVGVKKNLPLYWKDKVTATLNQELEGQAYLLNLASNEYFAAVDSKAVAAEIISPQFKDFKNGKLKIISFFAKKARGMMVRYVLDNEVNSLAELKDFNMDGYQYSEEHTVNSLQPVFIR